MSVRIVDRLDLLGVDIVDRAIADEETGRAINPHMALDQNFARLGVVSGGIGVDIAVAGMDGYIAVSGGDPILVVRVAGRRDFDRLLLAKPVALAPAWLRKEGQK